MRTVAIILSALLLAACGGGGGGSSSPSSSATPEQLALMVDSLGRAVPEADFGGGDSGAAGADGSAGDGKPIANAPVTVRDSAGHSVSATTDSLGYYRVSVKGFTPPFVAKVVRADGSAWYSPSISPVKVRGFVTLNLTGLTDKLASYVATTAGASGGAAQLTPSMLVANSAAVKMVKTCTNDQLAAQIVMAGLNPATFDPVTTPYTAVLTDAYDKLLESVVITKDASGFTIVQGDLPRPPTIESFVFTPGIPAKFDAVLGTVFTADAPARLEVTFGTDMCAQWGTKSVGVTSTFTPGGNKNRRLYVIYFLSYQPGATFTLVGAQFISSNGIAMAQDRVFALP